MRILPRRLLLGIELENGDRAVARRIVEGGAAQEAGLAPGDIVTSVGGVRVGSSIDVRAAVRRAAAHAGETVTIGFRRGEEELTRTVVARRAPPPGVGELHDHVERDGALLRSIVRRPSSERAGPAPAILFVPGLGTASIERAFPELFDAFAARGVVTMRLERRGIGDSEGPPPEETGLDSDIADLRAALSALRAYDFVDSGALFVLGHSIGGMIAPLLLEPGAADCARGYVVYGSSAEPWLDCVEASARRQHTLRGEEDGAGRARAMREAMRRVAVTDGRPVYFHEALHDAKVADAWSRVRATGTARVLSLHGEHDWVVSVEEAARIADLAGGTFRSIARLDHLFGAHGSLAESLRDFGRGVFGEEAVATACEWMRTTCAVSR